MPRNASTTTATPRARRSRATQDAAAQTAEVETTPATPSTEGLAFSEDFVARLDSIRGHAAECGRLDCGHLGKSASQAVRRAVILYVAEGAGATLALDGETPEVVAVLGVLRQAQHARPVFVRQGRRNVPVVAGMTLVWPDPTQIKMTPQRVEVGNYLLRGFSATQISSDPTRMVAGQPAPRHGLTARTIETVKSHMGYLRRETRAHDITSACLSLHKAGRLSDPAIVWAEADAAE